MSESATKHIARLDFDISAAESQLKNIQAQIAGLTNFINSQNWDLSALMNVNSAVSQTTPLQNAVQQINVLTAAQAALQKQINSLMSQRKDAANQQLSTESQIADALNTIRSAYNTLSAAGTKMNSDEAERANRLKTQLEYIEKQYQANGQLTAAQKAHLEAAQKTAKALKEAADKTTEGTKASENAGKTEEQRYNAVRKLASALSSINSLQTSINKLSDEEKSKREQTLNSLKKEYDELKQKYDTNKSLTTEEQKQLEALKSKINLENQLVKLVVNEQNAQNSTGNKSNSENQKLDSAKKLTSAMKSLSNLQTSINKLSDEEKAKREQTLSSIRNEYEYLKKLYDINGTLTSKQQEQLEALKSRIDLENQNVKLLSAEASSQTNYQQQISSVLATLQAIAAAGTNLNSTEAEKAEKLKAQLEYIEKQYQANGQLTAAQKAHLEAAQKTAKALKEAADRAKEEAEASQRGKSAEEEKYEALRKLAAAQKSLYDLQENINKLSGEEKSKREQALAAMQNEYSALKQAFDTNGTLTAEQQKQLNLLKSKIEAENQMVKLLNTEQGAQSAITSSNSTLLSKMQSTLISAGKQAVSGGLDEMKTAENAMMEIQRIINSTDAETAKMRQNLLDLGNEYGRNFEEVADIALRFTQAGYQMEETLSMTANSLLALNTAEMDSEQATVDLIAILKQWEYESDDLMSVIDKLNYTADTNATTSQDLIEALQKVGSTAKAANLSFDETVGYLTAMKEASGAAGKEVGNAFKSILSYIQRDTALDAFDAIGIDVWADKSTGTLNAMGDILQQMAEKWNSSSEEMKTAFMDAADAAGFMNEDLAADLQLTDTYNEYMENMATSTDKANDAESRLQANMAAGTYRRNYYIGLMQNFNDAMTVTTNLQNAMGHSEEQNVLYMETLTAKTEQLSAALTELAVYAGDAGLLDLAKGAVEAATACTKFLKNQKALLSTLTLVAGIIATLKAQKIAEEITAIGKSAAGVATNISNIVNVIKGVEITAETASGAVTKLSAAMGAIGLAVTAITLVITAVKAYKQAVEEARQATIEDAEEEQKKADTLTDIKKRYEELSERAEELRNNHKKTAEEQQELADVTEELNSIQEKLNETYSVQAANIDLVNGKRDEELNKLNQLEEAELNLLKAKQEAALAVLTEDAENDTAVTSQKYDYDKTKDERYLSAAIEAGNGTIGTRIDNNIFNPDKVQIYVDATKDGLQDLKNAIQAVEDAGGKYSGVWTALTEAMVSAEEQIKNVDNAEKELAETDMALYIKETGNAIENLTLKNFEEWKNGLINVETENQNVRNALEALAEEQREVAKQNTFKELFTDDDGNLTQAYNDLLKLAEQGKLTADDLSVFFDTSETGFADFRQQIYDSGLSLNDVAIMFQNIATMGVACCQQRESCSQDADQ